jgi:hypothetical protein
MWGRAIVRLGGRAGWREVSKKDRSRRCVRGGSRRINARKTAIVAKVASERSVKRYRAPNRRLQWLTPGGWRRAETYYKMASALAPPGVILVRGRHAERSDAAVDWGDLERLFATRTPCAFSS